eukprot:gb/GEZN01002782.1/.p1 GENE.gb/GEZN01002782.1/~~gb/GEZN01002782.1/.p1  ORF type:complete len:534 (+),score=108.85 gb/GEZN01002782.1/:212-1603(+)
MPNETLEQHTVQVCQSRKRRWGEERLWGSVAWAFTHVLMGFLIDVYGTNILYCAVLFSGLLLLSLLVSWHVPTPSRQLVAQHASLKPGYLLPPSASQLRMLEHPSCKNSRGQELSLSTYHSGVDSSLEGSAHSSGRVSFTNSPRREGSLQKLPHTATEEQVEYQPQQQPEESEEEETERVRWTEVMPEGVAEKVAAEGKVGDGESEDMEGLLEGLQGTWAEEQVDKAKPRISPLKQMQQVLGLFLASPAFFVMSLVRGVSSGCSETLLFLFFLKDLHASNMVAGCSVVVTLLTEIPIYACSAVLLRRVGVRNLITISFIAYIVRMVAFSVLSQPYLLLLIEMFHGVTQAAWLIASMEHVSDLAPPASFLAASAQGLSDVVRFGVGQALGAVLGGVVIQRFSSHVLYRAVACMNVVFLVLWLVATRSGLTRTAVVSSKSQQLQQSTSVPHTISQPVTTTNLTEL